MSSTISTDTKTADQVPRDASRRGSEPRFAELAAILLTVMLADVTIYRGHGYAGLAVFLLGTLGTLYFGKHRRKIHQSLWIVAGMSALLAARLVWYGSPLQVIVGLFLLLAFATALDGETPYLLAVLTMGSQTLAAGFRSFAEYASKVDRAGSARLRHSGLLNVMLPAAALLVFGGLFVLANPDAVSFLGRHLERVLSSLREWLVHMAVRPTEPLFWLAVALLVAGLLRPIFRLSSLPAHAAVVPDTTTREAPLFSAFRNTLLTVIVLFAGYLAYEFYTMWTRDFPPGFYYSGYAHEGAAWLTVALALATLLLSLVFSGRVLQDPRLPKLRWLAWIWSLENFLLSLAVYNRLFIYIDFNGMTRMRIVGLFGISLVVVGFLLVVWKIARGHDFPWLVHRQMWALAGAVYLFALLPVDGIAASYNVRHILQGNLSASMQIGVHKLDLDGIMALPPLLDSTTAEIRQGAAALIAERYGQLQTDHQQRQQAGWTAYQSSDEKALARFEAVRDKWKVYEDAVQREAAIKRFHDFAYQWY